MTAHCHLLHRRSLLRQCPTSIRSSHLKPPFHQNGDFSSCLTLWGHSKSSPRNQLPLKTRRLRLGPYWRPCFVLPNVRVLSVFLGPGQFLPPDCRTATGSLRGGEQSFR